LLTVLLPAFNEARYIHEAIISTAETLREVEFEIIAIDDGSTDSTYSEAIRACNDDNGYDIRVVRCEKNGGKASALRFGFKLARGNLVALYDSDLEIHPSFLPKMLDVMKDQHVDIVVASAHNSNATYKMPFVRRCLSLVYYALVGRFILPISHEAGMQVFRREILEKAFPLQRENGYGAEIELLLLAHIWGCKIVEFPVSIIYKGSGGMDVRDFIYDAFETARIWFRYKVRREYLETKPLL